MKKPAKEKTGNKMKKELLVSSLPEPLGVGEDLGQKGRLRPHLTAGVKK
jgi:hypothetical protein